MDKEVSNAEEWIVGFLRPLKRALFNPGNIKRRTTMDYFDTLREGLRAVLETTSTTTGVFLVVDCRFDVDRKVKRRFYVQGVHRLLGSAVNQIADIRLCAPCVETAILYASSAPPCRVGDEYVPETGRILWRNLQASRSRAEP